MTLAFHALALSEAPERLEEVRVLAQVHTLLLLRSFGKQKLSATGSSLIAFKRLSEFLKGTLQTLHRSFF